MNGLAQLFYYNNSLTLPSMVHDHVRQHDYTTQDVKDALDFMVGYKKNQEEFYNHELPKLTIKEKIMLYLSFKCSYSSDELKETIKDLKRLHGVCVREDSEAANCIQQAWRKHLFRRKFNRLIETFYHPDNPFSKKYRLMKFEQKKAQLNDVCAY